MIPLDAGWVALFGTLFGGVVLEFVRKMLGKRQVQIDEATRIRNELRDQIEDLKDDIVRLEAERDRVREDYYKLYEKYIAQATQLTIALDDIRKTAEGK